MLAQYYTPWHLKLQHCVAQQRNRFGYCVIIDCHSFPSIPLPTEVDSQVSRPDICVGTTTHNTPSWLEDAVLNGFRKQGYRCESNAPFSGSMVPSNFEGDPKVVSVMIEINRDLYLEHEDSHHSAVSTQRRPLVHDAMRQPKKGEGFELLRNQITTLLLAIAQEAECRLGQ